MKEKYIEHSPIGGSTAPRWLACPGSVRLCKDIEPTSSKYADEGKCAHIVAANMLGGNKPTAKIPLELAKYYTDDMELHAKTYVDFIENLRSSYTFSEILVEHKFSLEHIHKGMFGTNDACIHAPFSALHILDFKYGQGVPVEVWNNAQLMYYALGALHELKCDVDIVYMHIVQPRSFGEKIKTSEIPATALQQWGGEVLKKGAELALSDNAPLKAGKHCREYFCPARNSCPALQGQLESAVGTELSNITNASFPAPDKLPAERLAKILSLADDIENWLADVKSYATAKAMQGVIIPDFKLVEKEAKRSITDPVVAVKELISKGYVAEQLYEQKLLSISALEKICGKEVIAPLCSKKKGDIILVHKTDKRPEITIMAEEFPSITTGDNSNE